jgi:hypothetical protein
MLASFCKQKRKPGSQKIVCFFQSFICWIEHRVGARLNVTRMTDTDMFPSVDGNQSLPCLEELVHRSQKLAVPARNEGRLRLIVSRAEDGARQTPETVELTIENGVPGDAWGRGTRNPETQITVMRHDIAELIASGQALTVFGDNFFVDLDISTPNLPAGTRLQVGKAVVEVTPLPHDGCRKFNARFGSDALRFVQARETRNQNYRGIHWRVITPGSVSVGEKVQVLSRPS